MVEINSTTDLKLKKGAQMVCKQLIGGTPLGFQCTIGPYLEQLKTIQKENAAKSVKKNFF